MSHIIASRDFRPPFSLMYRRITTSRRAERNLPARRIGQPEHIAQAILFLATNPFATGTTVTVDGGCHRIA